MTFQYIKIKTLKSLSVLSMLVVMFFVANSVLAAAPTVVVCRQTDCTIDTGQGAYLQVVPRDDFGSIIAGTPVSYTWSTEIGIFVAPPTVTPTVSGSPANAGKVWNDANSRGESRVFLSIPAGSLSQEINKIVTVLAVYADGTPKTFSYTISSNCITDPTLYYGVASVEQGSYRHSSTAEVLETCRPEYRLKPTTGEKY